MKVIQIEKVDDCLEASKVYDFVINNEITDEFIHYCGKIGKLIYKPDFAKPYFKVLVKGKYTFKGAIGNDIIRILFPDNANEHMHLPELKQYLEQYK